MMTLTKVYQQNINADSGDCFAACIASLTNLPIETIPLFRGNGLIKERARWLFERGFQLTHHNAHRVDKGYYIVCKDAFLIKNVGWRCHASIYKQGKEVHNPISNRSNQEIIAVNKKDGLSHSDMLDRRFGILFIIMLRSINVTDYSY